MYNLVSTLAPSFLIGSSSYLQHNISDKFEFRPGSTKECGISYPLVLEKFRGIVLNTLAPSFLIGSSSLLQDMHISLDEIEF